MPSAEVIDFARVLAAIPGDNRVGADIRADRSARSPYFAITSARDAARAAEKYWTLPDDMRKDALGQPLPNPGKPNWQPVLENCAGVLTERSKDLEVAAYYVESLARQHGFPGVRGGLRLLRELCEQFWEAIYPLPDEDGMDTRTAPITRLNGEDADGTLIGPILNVPITEGKSPYSTAQYNQAAKLEGVDATQRARQVDAGAVSLDMFNQSVAETTPEFFKNVLSEIEQCEDEYGKLCALLEEKCGTHAPPSSNIRNALANCREIVQNISKSTLEGAAAEAAAGAPGGATPGAVASGPIRTREDAFRMLLLVADFFRRTEPHTPVSYALEQAVRWGKMPLPDLLAELIPEATVRDQLFKLVGIRPPQPPAAS